ncbi:hypothetical protein HY464_02565 [Candidatus Peregrinibacteria bacterium]|nr:hypothetical protein [Candidatus Peregrinibacteria bacterium]
MSNTHRTILLVVSVVALVASAVLAATPAASRAQLTWQGSYVTSPRPVEGPRLIQGHSAAPDVLVSLQGNTLLWQFSLGMFLMLLGFGLHALLVSPRDRAVPVRVRSPSFRRRIATCYWYRIRV